MSNFTGNFTGNITSFSPDYTNLSCIKFDFTDKIIVAVLSGVSGGFVTTILGMLGYNKLVKRLNTNLTKMKMDLIVGPDLEQTSPPKLEVINE